MHAHTHTHTHTHTHHISSLKGQAGHYGAYECDLPMTTLKLLVDHLRKLDPQPDFIIYTGTVLFFSMHVGYGFFVSMVQMMILNLYKPVHKCDRGMQEAKT